MDCLTENIFLYLRQVVLTLTVKMENYEKISNEKKKFVYLKWNNSTLTKN